MTQGYALSYMHIFVLWSRYLTSILCLCFVAGSTGTLLSFEQLLWLCGPHAALSLNWLHEKQNTKCDIQLLSFVNRCNLVRSFLLYSTQTRDVVRFLEVIQLQALGKKAVQFISEALVDKIDITFSLLSIPWVVQGYYRKVNLPVSISFQWS